ncbi:MAG: ATP-binding protein [Terracidiphilus sp.]|nr:ATP-binding protein [Terracidiphilus sp.]MDR3799077.1 ATP-binding protein [Terracidiphilus sp.]
MSTPSTPSATGAGAPPPSQAQNPWPGLFWYTEEQAHLFFGREAETQELLRLIQRETLTVLFGRSGLGKTSLLRAGVFPRLRQDGYFPVVLRLDYSSQAANPVEQVKVLTEAAARESGNDIESTQDVSGPETLWEYFHRVHFWGPRNDRLAPVLVFDQFEEIFTIGSRRHDETQILEQLADLAENRIPAVVRQRAEASGERLSVEAGTPNYKIVLSLREDFVWRLDSLRPILPAILRNRFALGPLDAARGIEIIRNPGKEWVTDEVAQDIIQAVISSRQSEVLDSATEEIEPAYLNVMCNELFERMVATGKTQITRELVVAEKGGILESLYERSLLGLGDSVREFVEEHLVTATGFRATIPVEEARREHISDDDLQKLVDRRLLRFEDRLGTRHVELAHDLLTGLVEKGRERRNRGRLRQQLIRARFRAAIAGTVALLALSALALTVLYWLFYVHPNVSYYASFMRRNGSYEMIGRLSTEEIGHRAESLRVTRKGFRGEVQAVEAINGYGHLIMDSQLDSSLFFPTSGMSGQFCRLEFSYDEKGQAVYEIARDMQGRIVFALNYAPAQAGALKKVGNVRNTRLFFVVGADGTTLSSGDIHYDSQGYISEIQFLSGGGTRMTLGATVIDQTNSKLGVTEQQFLDSNGDPLPANGGFVAKAYVRDAQGELIQTTFEDASGKPVPSPDAVPPMVRWQLDKWGNQIEESYFDAANKPAFWEAGGFQRDEFTLDDHGSLKEERFFGPDGKPIAQKGTGCYAYFYERDQSGNGTMKGCLDAQGAPLNYADAGYQRVAFQYDSSERTVGNLFFDRDGKPVADKRSIGTQYPEGCFGWLWGYDQNFVHTNSVCLDANGKAHDPAQLHDLAHVSHEVSFDFDRAFQLDQQLVAQDPTPGYRLDLEEAALTADRFDVCQAQATNTLDSELNPSQIIVRDALLLACQYASGNKTAARATLVSLTGRVNRMSAGVWDFDGTRYYLQTSNHFQAGSDEWDKLFLSLQKGDEKGAASALSQLQPLLKD